ncbi:hypothetical protein ACOMHN_016178 [Nucella lapillus]
MTALYNNYDDVKLFCGMLDALAFLPVDDVPTGMEYLHNNTPDGAEELLEYFEATYVRGTFCQVQLPAANDDAPAPVRVRRRPPLFPPGLWNVHEARMRDGNCTNNQCEAWNLGFSHLVGHNHPSLWTLINALQKDYALLCTSLLQDARGEPPRKRVKRSSKDLQTRLKAICTQHRDGVKTLKEALRALGHCIRFLDKMTVEFKLVFLKINDIDTLSQQFEAEVYVQAKWQEPAFNGVNPKELDNLLPGDLWDPHLIVLNVAGDFDHERRSYVVRYEEEYESPVVLHRWRFKGLFRKRLDLRNFPFDIQDLTIQMSTERSFEEIKMIHDTHQLSSVNTRTFQDSQEWAIYNHVQCDYRNTTVEYASSTIHPIIVFSCRVRRRVGYFIWNIVFIVFQVLVLSLLTVSVDPTTSDRLASTMTLFLTMVAFKLVVKQSLPTISYLTYLDIYVLGSLMYLVLYAMENSSMNSLGSWMDHDLVKAYDKFFCMFLAAILILFHLAFIVHIQFTALKRHREMSENDKRYGVRT